MQYGKVEGCNAVTVALAGYGSGSGSGWCYCLLYAVRCCCFLNF
jgi:hypothetical protein